MKKIVALSLVVISIVFFSFKSNNPITQNKNSKITFVENNTDKKIDIFVDGQLFTSYLWSENITKPILYPICTSKGTEITRGFPINPKAGERTDHPHQLGMWLTYGNVEGYDFWGNGSQGLGTTNETGGVIKHLKTNKKIDGVNEGLLITTESWINPSGKELLKEQTEFHFIARGSLRIIDRITVLKANDKEIKMPDTKEGMFGIRVARQLELPSKDDITLYSADGHPTTVGKMSNEGISGNYLNSEGIEGENVWGKNARWMNLYGIIDDEKISLIIFDHPKNLGYPTYWHARGYGLFAANPLGVRDFTEMERELNFSIPVGESITFRYRTIISSGKYLSDNEINEYAKEFAEKY